MTNLLVSTPLSPGLTAHRWSLSRLFQTLISRRREARKISALARRERLRLGYRHIPQRVWDRRSALFVERQ